MNIHSPRLMPSLGDTDPMRCRYVGLRRSVLLVALLFSFCRGVFGQAGTAAPTHCVEALLDQAADELGLTPGWSVIALSGERNAWLWLNGKWTLATYKGVALGAHKQPQTKEVVIWPNALKAQKGQTFGLGQLCDPSLLGSVYPTLVHELMHFLCPEHDASLGLVSPWDPAQPVPPAIPSPAPAPDCNNMNYAMNAAIEVCELLGDVAACLELPACPDPDDPDPTCCDGIRDGNGDIIPGLERATLPEFCKSLSAAYEQMQERWNTPENAQIAFGCICTAPPWNAGQGYPNCPPMPKPDPSPGAVDGGCKGTPEETYPNGVIIPNCPHSCP